MSEAGHRAPVRRILLAIDPAVRLDALLAEAAELAARLDATIAALYIEDAGLMRLAELPFGAQINMTTAERRPLDVVSLERELREAASHARRLLESAAVRRRISWSFSVVRGEIAGETLSAAIEADLVMIDCSRRFGSLRAGGRSAPWRVAREASRPVLLRTARALGGAVMVLCHAERGAESCAAAIAAAGRLVPVGERPRVFVTGEAAEDVAEKLRDILHRRGDDIRIRALPALDAASLCAEIRSTLGGATLGVVVLPGDSPLLYDLAAFEELERAAPTILVTR